MVDIGYSSDTMVDIDGVPAIQWLILDIPVIQWLVLDIPAIQWLILGTPAIQWLQYFLPKCATEYPYRTQHAPNSLCGFLAIPGRRRIVRWLGVGQSFFLVLFS